MNEPGLDQKRVTELARGMLVLIRANYQLGPLSRDRVYEALNALAFCAATAIRGAEPDQALEWFSMALNLCLKDQDELELQLRQERNSYQDLYYAARRTITGLHKDIAAQAKYIEELERQLVNVAPGLLREAREYLGRE